MIAYKKIKKIFLYYFGGKLNFLPTYRHRPRLYPGGTPIVFVYWCALVFIGRFGAFPSCFLLLLFAPVLALCVQMYCAFLLFAYTANKRANLGYFRPYLGTYFFRLSK